MGIVPRVGRSGGLARVALMLGLGFGLALGLAADSRASGRSSRRAGALQDVMQRELALTQEAMEIERGIAALQREGESLDYAARLLAHRGSEGLRRLDAYRVSRQARERQSRRRARSLYKLARGGMLRLVFEDISEEVDPEGGTTAQRRGDEAGRFEEARNRATDRVTRGRTIRWLVLHDLEELAVHRRAEARARTELLAAAREQASIDALSMVRGLQRATLEAAQRGVTPVLARTHRERRRLERRHPAAAGRQERALRSELRRERHALRRHRGLDMLEPSSLARPVRGAVVGVFGAYEDRILRVPMHRNGVELRANAREQVGAMAAGEVAFVGPLPGFDSVVVLDHGGGYLSLTGRLISVGVEVGQEVEAGALLGRVAPKILDDGLGRTLYLEIRHGERPIDPRPYLRRRRG